MNDDQRDLDQQLHDLGGTAPEPPDLSALASSVEQRARRRRTARRGVVAGAAAAAAVVAAVLPLALAGPAPAPQDGPADAAPSQATAPTSTGAPEQCVAADDAERSTLDGGATWARFCPGPDGLTAPAEVPSDALVSHLGFVSTLGPGAATDCPPAGSGRTYTLQVGFADGSVAEVRGRTDPGCAGNLAGSTVVGPPGLGVYGAAMAAFGQQYADGFDDVAVDEPLACPADPERPDSVDRDGASAGLETGYRYGRRHPMVMPVAATRGILCTWRYDGSGPVVTELGRAEAERVRIGMHAVYEAMVDCGGTPGPTYTAVVEDRTGTRRAVTLITSQCSTVVRSDGGYGLGFAWLDR